MINCDLVDLFQAYHFGHEVCSNSPESKSPHPYIFSDVSSTGRSSGVNDVKTLWGSNVEYEPSVSQF